VERRGDGLGKVEEVTEGLNNMYTVVGHICPPWHGCPDMVASGVV
jgi:hypothetical protein